MSSSDYAIRIDGIGKRYRLGLEQAGGAYKYKSLRDSLGNIAKRPWRAIKETLLPDPMDEANSFWALKDVSFDVKRGEVVGIIGRNGAGKSTLLKILSRITKPTTGHIELRGRVGSLLEVGTGFHPELTGRENIFLNGAVLGMTRSEVKSKFDEIVAFSEIEKFIDTPVKHYSSGMYMRLAFAIAAHLEPEILVVDEVLAVGDASFQKKCLGKMKDVAQQGQTVLFVSHNMSAVANLCDRCACLDTGKLQFFGETDRVVSEYIRYGSGAVNEVTFSAGPLRRCRVICDRKTIRINADYATEIPVELPVLGFVICTADGIPIFGDNPRLSRVSRPEKRSTKGSVSATIDGPPLRDGDYMISLWFGDSTSDSVSYRDVLSFAVCGQESGAAISRTVVGSVVPMTRWEFSTNG